MAFLNDSILDAALAVLTSDANRLDICSSEPTTYAQATDDDTGLSLGNKTSYSVGSAEDRSPNGRKVVAAAVTDGSVSKTGTASHWAITNTAGSVLLATGALSSPQSVTASNTFTLGAFDIGIPDAV